MFEAHAVVKPGRPTLLLLLSAAALVAALGLAWTQIREARALGPPVAIDDAPLRVQPPLGWVSGSDPALFGKLVQKQVWGTRIWAAERTVKYRYNDYFEQFVRLFNSSARHLATPASIGGYPGVQCVVERQSTQMPGQSILRWAATPQGALLGIEYTPLAEVSHGDIYLLDEICKAVTISSEPGSITPESLPEHFGVAFNRPSDARILGPVGGDQPGFWLLMETENRPRWALGVFRSYLGRTRDPMERLSDEARRYWSTPVRPIQSQRDDGVFVGAVIGPNGQIGASLWMIAQSTVEAAFIVVLADPAYATEANQQAAMAAREMTFTRAYPG